MFFCIRVCSKLDVNGELRFPLLSSSIESFFEILYEGGYLKPFTRGGLEMIRSTVFREKELAHQNCRAYKGDPYDHFATIFEWKFCLSSEIGPPKVGDPPISPLILPVKTWQNQGKMVGTQLWRARFPSSDNIFTQKKSCCKMTVWVSSVSPTILVG